MTDDFVESSDLSFYLLGKMTERRVKEESGNSPNQTGAMIEEAIPDNGGTQEKYGHESVGILRGMKGDALDGAHRLPFIAKWSGKIKPGGTTDKAICFTDMLATFAEIVDDSLSVKNSPDSHSLLLRLRPMSKSV